MSLGAPSSGTSDARATTSRAPRSTDSTDPADSAGSATSTDPADNTGPDAGTRVGGVEWAGGTVPASRSDAPTASTGSTDDADSAGNDLPAGTAAADSPDGVEPGADPAAESLRTSVNLMTWTVNTPCYTKTQPRPSPAVSTRPNELRSRHRRQTLGDHRFEAPSRTYSLESSVPR
ncbi:hypothetical protein [Candidatus Poriferisodalis sp.]|uniref:hypothetical protein n=1 Tax=Candidatus Poriferisodalis sp. TaxID=3101277 RepID=UPI003AF72433